MRKYSKWYIWEEIIAYPIMIYYWCKGKKIETRLYNRIKNAKKQAYEVALTPQEKDIKSIEYKKLDNCFCVWFNEIKDSRNLTFDDKIKYCLKEFRKASLRQVLSSNLIKLEEDFLVGAEKTLFIYFVLQKEMRLADIMEAKYIEPFLAFLQKKKFIDENNNFLTDNKSLFIRLHRLLKDKAVINTEFNDVTIIEAMKNEYNSTFDQGTFSRAVRVELKESEMLLQKLLLEELGIYY